MLTATRLLEASPKVEYFLGAMVLGSGLEKGPDIQ